jgi:WD40 repeat protein
MNRVVVGLLVAMVAGCGGDGGSAGPAAGTGPAPETAGGPGPALGIILFGSVRDGGGLFVMAADGTRPTRVVEQAFLPRHREARLDPAGRRLAFKGCDPDRLNGMLCVATAGGSGLTWRLDFSDFEGGLEETEVTMPLFSPDGQTLAVGLEGAELSYIALVRLGNCPATPADCPSPDFRAHPVIDSPIAGVGGFDFSPDGKALVLRNPEGFVRLDLATSRQTQLTTTNDYMPAFSPDGTRIAFLSETGGTTQVHVMNADGSGRQQLTHDRRSPHLPRWSPDGTKLAFTRASASFPIDAQEDLDEPELYVLDLASRQEVNVSRHRARDEDHAWSPDGQWLAFTSHRDGDIEVYAVRPDGTGLTRLTHSPGVDLVYDWR